MEGLSLKWDKPSQTFQVKLTLRWLCLLILDLQGSLVLWDERLQAVPDQLFVALVLGGAELLHHGALPLPGLEVTRVSRQLNPLVLPMLIRLNERRPLNHAAKFSPFRWLKNWRKSLSESVKDGWLVSHSSRLQAGSIRVAARPWGSGIFEKSCNLSFVSATKNNEAVAPTPPECDFSPSPLQRLAFCLP